MFIHTTVICTDNIQQRIFIGDRQTMSQHSIQSARFGLFPGGTPGLTRWRSNAAGRKRPKRRRGKRGGLHARLKARASRPPLPSLLLANVTSLDNKMNKLRTRITSQRETRDCCALVFTETWLSDSTPESAVRLDTHSLHRGDRTHASGKLKGGGTCIYINKRWCSDVQIVSKHCTSDLEYLMLKCKPFHLPREFCSVFILSIYIPPSANPTQALAVLYDAINKQENKHPEAVFIVAGDFNHCNLKSVLPAYKQYVTFPTREKNILDHVYCNVKGAYKAVPRPHFGQSDHISVFLYPAYRQLLKQTPAVRKTVKVWSEEAEQELQDCFQCTQWDVFRPAAMDERGLVNLEEYSSVVSSYIDMCTDLIVPHKQIVSYPNNKPWINAEACAALHARSKAFASGNTEDYKQASYNLRTVIKRAKNEYRARLEGHYTSADTRRMWQGLETITGYKGKGGMSGKSNFTPDEFNEFYARFEAHNIELASSEGSGQLSPPPFPVSPAEVERSLRRINPRKAAGPDNILGRALKVCSPYLADVLADIFNLSLVQATVPTCYKTTTIIPLPKKGSAASLNDYRPVALTPIVMKCFERIIMHHI